MQWKVVCIYLNSDVPGWGVDLNQEYIKTTNYNLNYNIRIYRDFLYIIVMFWCDILEFFLMINL